MEKETKRILIFSVLIVLSIFLIPTFIGVRNFGNIFSCIVIPVCFFVLIQRIKLRDSIYAVALSVIVVFFFILGFDYFYLKNYQFYDMNIVRALACLYISSGILAIFFLKDRKD